MTEFDYRAFLKNNPLLKGEVKETLITESQTESNIEEAENNKYDELIGGIIRRLHDLQVYVEANEPSKSSDLQAIVDALDKFDEFMAYGNNLEETEEVTEVEEIEETIEEEELNEMSTDAVDALVGLIGAGGLGAASIGITKLLSALEDGKLGDKGKAVAQFLKTAGKASSDATQVHEEEIEEVEEVEEVASSKMKVSEFKARIKEEIKAALMEADEEEDVEVNVEPEADAEVDAEAGAEPEFTDTEGLSDDETQIQDSLKVAYDNAVQIGDQKLADQIGNTITFFTRSHVVNK